MSVLADVYFSRDDNEAVVYDIAPARFADRMQFTSQPKGRK